METCKTLRLLLVGTFCAPAVLPAQMSDTVSARATVARPDSVVGSLLTSPLGSRGPTGLVKLSGTTLRMEWTGDRTGSARPWSVRRGTCAMDEGALPIAIEFMPLRVGDDGTAAATTAVDVQMLPTPVYVVVHGSSSGLDSEVLACGALSDPAVAGVSNSEIDHSVMDHSKMDHSRIDHSSMVDVAIPIGSPAVDRGHEHPDTLAQTTAEATPEQRSTGLFAIYVRMMADPVIRERVRTDPELQRMMGDLDGGDTMMRNSDARVAPKAVTKLAPNAAPAKDSSKKAATTKPAVKPAPKPSPAMPGMDHSKMPGMKKPPS